MTTSGLKREKKKIKTDIQNIETVIHRYIIVGKSIIELQVKPRQWKSKDFCQTVIRKKKGVL